MTASQPIAAAANPSAPAGGPGEAMPQRDPQVLLAQLQLQQLQRMADIGLALLDDLDEERDLPAEKRASVAQRAQSFDKITRALRQIMALQTEVIGLREKRVRLVESDRAKARQSTVRRSVDHSLATARPDLDRPKRERLLADLFVDYRKFATGTIPELIAGICKDLGIPADLTLWEEPSPRDIALPAGFDWVVPASGDKPYTVIKAADGIRVRRPYDSPQFAYHGGAPPGG